MNIYLVVNGRGALDILSSKKYHHILVSQLHRGLVKRAVESDADLIIDSGAYTVWTKGEKININNYIDFCKEIKEKGKKNVFFVNLDVIPGRFGFVPSKKEIERSAQEGWENYLKMKEAGLKVIHLFHQHEDFKWLKRLMDTEDDYIGISPANDLHSKKRLIWLKKVFNIVRDKKKTHGFGVTDLKILKEIPFYSADSSNWSSLTRYGNVARYKNLGMKTMRYKNMRDAIEMGLNSKAITDHRILREYLAQVVNNYLELERDITKLWEARGIKWE